MKRENRTQLTSSKNKLLNDDLSSVKSSVSWPQIIESLGWQIAKNENNKGTAHCQKHGVDKTPSLFWNEEKGFYCQGCAYGGDRLKFLKWVLNCDFITAKKHLYQLAGIPLPHYDGTTECGRNDKTPNLSTERDGHLKLFQLMRLDKQTSDLLYDTKKRRLTGELHQLEEDKHSVGLDNYYRQQQLLEMKLNTLDEQHIAYRYRTKKRLENYAKKYLGR